MSECGETLTRLERPCAFEDGEALCCLLVATGRVSAGAGMFSEVEFEVLRLPTVVLTGVKRSERALNRSCWAVEVEVMVDGWQVKFLTVWGTASEARSWNTKMKTQV